MELFNTPEHSNLQESLCENLKSLTQITYLSGEIRDMNKVTWSSVVCALGKQASCCEESYGNRNMHNTERDFRGKNLETQLDWTSSKSDQFTTFTLTMAKCWLPYHTVPWHLYPLTSTVWPVFHTHLPLTGTAMLTAWPDKKQNKQFKFKVSWWCNWHFGHSPSSEANWG
jgi:hypothetical protein